MQPIAFVVTALLVVGLLVYLGVVLAFGSSGAPLSPLVTAVLIFVACLLLLIGLVYIVKQLRAPKKQSKD
jgi:glycerol uptake facilitator-like aquaporin